MPGTVNAVIGTVGTISGRVDAVPGSVAGVRDRVDAVPGKGHFGFEKRGFYPRNS